MKATVCTLFEGHYHYGVAALVNSLYARGFRGTVWAGYRGALPEWAGGGAVLEVGEGLTLRFVPLTTEAHFTNYKAAFALEILERLEPQAGGVFYFDPDIVVSGRWSFFEEWIEYGVALCEDSTSPMSESHPIRGAWRKFAAARGLALHPRGSQYVNGGFIGVARSQIALLRTWSRILDWVKEEIGTAGNFNWADKDRTFAFYRNDQDALNIAIEADATPVSIVGRDGMGFGGGGYLMYHSLGAPKPWRKRFLWEAIKGWPPTSADKAFLASSDGPIAACSAGELAAKRCAAWIAGAICRIVRKGGW